MILENHLPISLKSHIRTGRQLADQRRRAPEEVQLPTACGALDLLLDGGLQRGAMVELIGRPSSGRFSMVLMALAATTGCGEAAALVDLGDGFDPRIAENAGVDLERLLWVRPQRMKETMAATEAILSSGIPLVVIDLGMPPLAGGRGVEASWLRLARRARAHRAALLIASPYRVSGTAAHSVLETRQSRAYWAGYGQAPTLLQEISCDVEKIKGRHQKPGAVPEGLELRSPELVPKGKSTVSRTGRSAVSQSDTPQPAASQPQTGGHMEALFRADVASGTQSQTQVSTPRRRPSSRRRAIA